MLELYPVAIGIVRVNAASGAVAEIEHAIAIASAWRLSPKEALLLCAPAEETRVHNDVETRLAHLDPDGIAVVDSDSFAAWKLEGAEADLALSRLSAIPLPAERPALVQGLVADVPTKIVAARSHFLLLVGSPLSHHVRERLLESSASVGIVEHDITTFLPAIEVVT